MRLRRGLSCGWGSMRWLLAQPGNWSFTETTQFGITPESGAEANWDPLEMGIQRRELALASLWVFPGSYAAAFVARFDRRVVELSATERLAKPEKHV